MNLGYILYLNLRRKVELIKYCITNNYYNDDTNDRISGANKRNGGTVRQKTEVL